MGPLAAQTALWLGIGVTAGLLVTLALFALFAVFLAVFDADADDIADVQRFIALTEEARRLVPTGLPLFDDEKAAATTAAILRFQAKKDEARLALWASRGGSRTNVTAKSGEPVSVRESGRHEPNNQSEPFRGIRRRRHRLRASAKL